MNILNQAEKVITSDRPDMYQPPEIMYEGVARMWQAMMKMRYGVTVPLTPSFVMLMMVSLKVARESGKPKEDNRVDMAGYTALADRLTKMEANDAEA